VSCAARTSGRPTSGLRAAGVRGRRSTWNIRAATSPLLGAGVRTAAMLGTATEQSDGSPAAAADDSRGSSSIARPGPPPHLLAGPGPLHGRLPGTGGSARAPPSPAADPVPSRHPPRWWDPRPRGGGCLAGPDDPTPRRVGPRARAGTARTQPLHGSRPTSTVGADHGRNPCGRFAKLPRTYVRFKRPFGRIRRGDVPSLTPPRPRHRPTGRSSLHRRRSEQVRRSPEATSLSGGRVRRSPCACRVVSFHVEPASRADVTEPGRRPGLLEDDAVRRQSRSMMTRRAGSRPWLRLATPS
jgi:hypothetical protein